MKQEHHTNGSDHSLVILHCGVESLLGVGSPRVPHVDVKFRTRAAPVALEHGEPSVTAQAYTEELKALK